MPLDSGSTWRPVGLVALREITTRLSSRPFRILTAITAVVILVVIVVLKIINSGGPSADNVGITDAALAKPLTVSAGAVGLNVHTHTVDATDGQNQVANGSLDALIAVDNDGSLKITAKKSVDSQLQSATNVLARQIALDEQITKLHGNPAAVDQAVAGATPQLVILQPAPKINGQALGIGIAAGALIYMTLLTLGQMVAQGVVEEKSSRVVELLLSTVRPWQLMAGKVLGIGAVGLIQVLIYGIVGGVAGAATGVLPSIGGTGNAIIGLIVWYILGFLMYSLAFAGAGALVSRQEDAAGVVMPILMFVIAAWVVGISVIPSDPTSSVAAIMSLIPMFAPTLMPMRIAMGVVPAWQYGLAVVLAVALIPALLWLAGRIYRNGVLRTGARVKLSEALKAA
jgi:ABC-2 type transport system permease protein